MKKNSEILTQRRSTPQTYTSNTEGGEVMEKSHSRPVNSHSNIWKIHRNNHMTQNSSNILVGRIISASQKEEKNIDSLLLWGSCKYFMVFGLLSANIVLPNVLLKPCSHFHKRTHQTLEH